MFFTSQDRSALYPDAAGKNKLSALLRTRMDKFCVPLAHRVVLKWPGFLVVDLVSFTVVKFLHVQ